VTYPVCIGEVTVEDCGLWSRSISISYQTKCKTHTWVQIRLSQTTTGPGSHLSLTWESALFSMWSYKRFKMAAWWFQLGQGSAEIEIRLAGFFLLQPHDSACELAIDIECFLPCNGMSADKRVNIFHWFAANDTASLSRAGIICLYFRVSRRQFATVKILTCSTPEWTALSVRRNPTNVGERRLRVMT
jgi:hypothetical protein